MKRFEVSIGSVEAGETAVQRADPERSRPVLLNGSNLVPWETVHISRIPEVLHELPGRTIESVETLLGSDPQLPGAIDIEVFLDTLFP